jgi:AcrR family transcriptional regulator
VTAAQGAALTTRERILEATLEVLARSGPRKLSLSDVAATAGVSRPTLYHWFPSKQALLDAFGRYEQDKYDAGIAAAVTGLEGEERLDAVLRHIVAFQQAYSLRRMVDVEPAHVVHQMTRVLPIMRERLEPLLPERDARTVASVVTRIALSHALIPDDDLDLFYAELRHAAGLDPVGLRHPPRSRRRPQRARSAKERR